MIVIPTFNGGGPLNNCLLGFEKFGVAGHEILVVDTGTTEARDLEVLDGLPSSYPTLPIKVERSEFGGYELGAIRQAWFKYKPETLMIVHDSMAPNSPDWWELFRLRLDAGWDVVPWIIAVPILYDGIIRPGFHPQTFVAQTFQVNPEAIPYVTVGSIFCAKSSILEKIEAEGWLGFPCLHKEESRAWERGWTAIFQKVGAQVSPVMAIEILSCLGRLEGPEQLPGFNKTLARRL